MKNAPEKPPAVDVNAVRDGEEIDPAALAAYLDGKLPGVRGTPAIWQFAGGHANLTYLLYYPEAEEGAKEFVLRRPPLGPVAATSHDMGREYRVLSVLYKAFPLAPRAYVYCDDASVIGAPFFVMERRRGVVVRGDIPPEFGEGRDPVANRKLSEVVIDTLAELHRVDPATVGLQTLGKPEGFLQRQVTGARERWERAKTREIPRAADVTRWLEDNLPTSPPPVLLHNDWRLDNMAVSPTDPGRAVAVFDWDMCTRGDPLADLGTLLTSWIEPGEESMLWLPIPSRTPGSLTRREAVARYAELTGIPVDNIGYYRVFGIFKIAVTIQQIFQRYDRGQTKDERFSQFGTLVEGMIERAAGLAEQSAF
jgi:aminoglycoside phosphotransferase (APT) family kinase protein